MTDFKTYLGITAVILTFVGYIPYLRDILKGTTKPHLYSWFLWSFVTFIAFALQVSDNAGPGALVTMAAATMCFVVLLLGLRTKAKRDITFLDTIFLVLAIIALILWLLAKQPVISAILITLTDVLGFAPTIRKSWSKPYTETVSFYSLNTLRFGLAVLALQQYTIITALYPIVWAFGNGLFALLLLLRRKQVSKIT